MNSPTWMYKLQELNGSKYIIGGNHDTKRTLKIANYLGIPVVGCMQYNGYILSHIPIHPQEVKFFKGNIHGHIHKHGSAIDELGNLVQLGPEYFNVNTEFHDFTPISMEVIDNYFKTVNRMTC